MSSTSIAGSIADPVDRFRVTSEPRTTGILDTNVSLGRDLSLDPRLAAELRSSVNAALAFSADTIAPAPGPSNFKPSLVVEKPTPRGRVETSGDASVAYSWDRLSEPREPPTAVTIETIDSLLRDLSAETRLAAGLPAVIDAASNVSSAGHDASGPSPSPSHATLQPAEDSVLKELDKLIARLDAGVAGLPPPPFSKTPKSRFFR